MDPTEALALFCQFAQIDEDEKDSWLPLCENAVAHLRTRLRDGMEEENGARLNLTAAGLAYHQYILLTGNSNASSVRVGQVTISESGRSISESGALAESLLSSVSDLLLGEPVIFERMPSNGCCKNNG